MENQNNSDQKRVTMEFKDIVMIVSLILSLVTAYFTVIRDHESRIVRLETKMESIPGMLDDMKNDLKEIKKEIKEILKK